MSFWQAKIDTRNFSFEGYGVTEYAARRALHTALKAHEEQYNLQDQGWYFPDDCEVRELTLGQGYRDRSPLGDIHPHARSHEEIAADVDAAFGGMHLSDPNSFKGPKG
jgi:hypothetical protein